MAFHLIRHLEPRGARGLCYGRRDLPCDEQTLLSKAADLRARLPERVLRDATMFTRPLSRCRVLAQVLSTPRTSTIAEELIELDFGAWEGLCGDALPRDEVDAWACGVIRAALAASGALTPDEAAATSIAFGSLHLIDPPAWAQERPCTI